MRSPKNFLTPRIQFSTHLDPRFSYDILTYREHRPYIEQRVLRDSELYPDTAKQYGELLTQTNHLVSRHFSRPLTIFCSYARPVLQEFPTEFWHQLFLLNCSLDLKKAGFKPELDILNYQDPPDQFMIQGVNTSNFVLLSGSQSLLHKLKPNLYPNAFIRNEIEYLNTRLIKCRTNPTFSGNKNFLLGVKLSHQPILESFPAIFRGRCDVFEFTDNQGHSCRSYLEYFLDILKRMLVFHLPNKELLDELVSLWEKNIKDMPIFKNGYLSEAHFKSIVELYREKDQLKDLSIREYIAQRAGKFDYSSLNIDGMRVASTIIETSYDKIPPWNLPRISSYFNKVNRKKEIAWINDKLNQEKALIKIGFYGAPGVGVSELIYKWLKEKFNNGKSPHGSASHFNAVFRFDASSNDALLTQFSDFFRKFNILLEGPISENSLTQCFKNYFEKQTFYSNWLIIFDNVEDTELIEKSLPTIGQGCIMFIASNKKSLGVNILTPVDILEIKELEVEDAITFFKEIIPYNKKTQQDLGSLESVVDFLGRLPIALYTAGIYLQVNRDITIKKFLGNFPINQKEPYIRCWDASYSRNQLLNRSTYQVNILCNLWNNIITDIKQSKLKYKNTIITVLKILAYFSPEKIPVQLIKNIIKYISDDLLFEDECRSVIYKLSSNYLLLESRDDHLNPLYFYINPLMQKFLRDKFPILVTTKKKNSSNNTDAKFLVQLLVSSINCDAFSVQISADNFDLLPHIETFLKHFEFIFDLRSLRILTKKNEHLRNNLCILYYFTGQLSSYKSEYQKALTFYKMANQHLSEKEKRLDKRERRLDYKLQHAIAQTYLEMHRTHKNYMNSESYFREALRLAEKFCYFKQEVHYKLISIPSVIAINKDMSKVRKIAHSEWHDDSTTPTIEDNANSDYAIILNDVACLQYDVGQYNQSVTSCKKIIQICIENKLPEAFLADVIHLQAMAYLATGNLQNAETQYLESLNIKKSIYGNHPVPTIAASKLGLGQVSYLKNHIEESKNLFQESLQISEKCFPKDTHPKSHSGVAAARNDIACCDFRLGVLLLAFQNFSLSLNIYLNLSNQAKNIDSAIVIYNLALLALFIGEANISKCFLIHAFSACKDSVDDDHTIKKKIKNKLYLDKDSEYFLADDNVGHLIDQLKSKIEKYDFHETKKASLTKVDLILSNRYSIFRTTKPPLISKDGTSDQSLKLSLSNN